MAFLYFPESASYNHVNRRVIFMPSFIVTQIDSKLRVNELYFKFIGRNWLVNVNQLSSFLLIFLYSYEITQTHYYKILLSLYCIFRFGACDSYYMFVIFHCLAKFIHIIPKWIGIPVRKNWILKYSFLDFLQDFFKIALIFLFILFCFTIFICSLLFPYL